MTRKIFTRAAANLFFSIDLTEFFWIKFTRKELRWQHFSLLKNKSPTLFIVWSEKKSMQNIFLFIQINLLVENRLYNEFFCHYGFKIESVTRTLHCRSENLQPSSTKTSEKHWWIWHLKIEISYLFRHERKTCRVAKVFRSSFGRT